MKGFTSNFRKVTVSDLYNISLMSAESKSKEVYIYEKGNLGDLIGKKKAEKLREVFLKNNIKVKQITNKPNLEKFSENDEFINKVMTFRYVPKEIFDAEYEILIFDYIVAIYDFEKILIIEDKKYSEIQKKLFQSIWEQGQSPVLGFDYKPNHSFYNSIDFSIGGLNIIIWPDVDAKESYKGLNYYDLKYYIKNIIESSKEDYIDISYVIGFIWSYNGEKMIDIWRFNYNHIDDRSGPLGNIIVYRNGKKCDNLGIASGNTLLVLGSEEKLRRQSSNLIDYLDGPIPKLPLEIVNGKDFFE